MIVVLMGVTGSGKTTIGNLLAKKLDATFADGDDFHPQANKEKMAAGHPLTDEDRQPWLEALNHLLRGWASSQGKGVLACSALKNKYRDTLSAGLPNGELAFVILEGSKELLTERLSHRTHHFMNPALLDSQLATLEDPSDAIHVPIDRTPDEIVADIVEQLKTA